MTPNRAAFLFFSAAVAVFIVQLACTPCNVGPIDPPDGPVIVHVEMAE